MFIHVQTIILDILAEDICSYRNAEQMKAFWKLSGISEKSENGGKCVHGFFVYNVMALKMDLLGMFMENFLLEFHAFSSRTDH